MAAMIDPDSALLADALAIWTGWGISPIPKRSDQRVISHFGAQVAQELLLILKSLQKDYYASSAENLSDNLIEMEKTASDHFRREHPAISEDIVKLFAWCYIYDYR